MNTVDIPGVKIFGIGTDLVDISRIAALHARHGQRFVERILSQDEIEMMKKVYDPVLYIAKRFAAKEAVAKAMGCGIGKIVAFNDISVLNHTSGQPYVVLANNALSYAQEHRFKEIHISLSDEKDYSLAFAVISASSNI